MSVFYLDPRHTRSLTLLKLTRSLSLFLRKLVQTISIVLLQSTSVYNSTVTLSFFLLLSFSFESFPVYLFVLHLDDGYSNNNFRPVFGERGEWRKKIRKNKRNTLISVVVLWCSITDVSVVSYLLLPPLCPFTVPHTLFLFENGITNRFRTP